MGEAEWQACTNPDRMLAFLRGKASDRKLRLFAVACVRQVWRKLREERERRAVQAAELYADGRLDLDALREARRAVSVGVRWTHGAARAAQATTRDAAWAAARQAQHEAIQEVWLARGGWETEKRVKGAAQLAQCDLFRDLFGPLPFRPVSVASDWLSASVVSLAQAAYGERDLPSGHLDASRLAILADALEESGCTDTAFLGHLRKPATHARGCWALDLLLGEK